VQTLGELLLARLETRPAEVARSAAGLVVNDGFATSTVVAMKVKIRSLAFVCHVSDLVH
jgi:hypothetical protein